MLLEFDGHKVETVASGEQALARLQKSSFDLAITDYEMTAMKGDRLAVAMKALVPHLPILMISAFGEGLRSSSNPLSGVDLLIAKPFGIQALRHALSTLLTNS